MTGPQGQAEPATAAAARRLLVLDDDPLIGMLIEAVARTAGFDSRVTLQPAEFFAALKEWPPSHIVLDLTLPNCTGEEVLAALAREACTARIILASGVEAQRLADCEAAGRAAGLSLAPALPKPFRAAALRDRLA
jgi:DNA-binding response OmpR family regulator